MIQTIPLNELISDKHGLVKYFECVCGVGMGEFRL
jgi:hypothetical protein